MYGGIGHEPWVRQPVRALRGLDGQTNCGRMPALERRKASSISSDWRVRDELVAVQRRDARDAR